VTYEELECVGLDNNLSRLVASFQVKLPDGFNGGLCQAGSTEYVAFWASGWNDSCGWTYLGTTGVAVHDVNPLPAGGLCYAAVLPVDLTHQRQPCSEPKELRVRAVLSWNAPPSTTDPDAGRFGQQPGRSRPDHARRVGTPGHRRSSDRTARRDPRQPDRRHDRSDDPGRDIRPPGRSRARRSERHGTALPVRPARFGPGSQLPGYQYRIQVRQVGDPSWTTVNNSFTAVDPTGTIFTAQVPSGDYFSYLPESLNADNVLAEWWTAGNQLWQVKIDILGEPGEDVHTIQLHNSGWTASIDIDILAGDCGKFRWARCCPGSSSAATSTPLTGRLPRRLHPLDVALRGQRQPRRGLHLDPGCAGQPVVAGHDRHDAVRLHRQRHCHQSHHRGQLPLLPVNAGFHRVLLAGSGPDLSPTAVCLRPARPEQTAEPGGSPVAKAGTTGFSLQPAGKGLSLTRTLGVVSVGD